MCWVFSVLGGFVGFRAPGCLDGAAFGCFVVLGTAPSQ